MYRFKIFLLLRNNFHFGGIFRRKKLSFLLFENSLQTTQLFHFFYTHTLSHAPLAYKFTYIKKDLRRRRLILFGYFSLSILHLLRLIWPRKFRNFIDIKCMRFIGFLSLIFFSENSHKNNMIVAYNVQSMKSPFFAAVDHFFNRRCRRQRSAGIHVILIR